MINDKYMLAQKDFVKRVDSIHAHTKGDFGRDFLWCTVSRSSDGDFIGYILGLSDPMEGGEQYVMKTYTNKIRVFKTVEAVTRFCQLNLKAIEFVFGWA